MDQTLFTHEIESSDFGASARAIGVFQAVAKASPVSVKDLLSGSGLPESALRDALAFLRDKGFIEEYIGLTPAGRGLAALVMADAPRPSEEVPSERLAKARSGARLKSAFAREGAWCFVPGSAANDWTMPPDRMDQRRFAASPGMDPFPEGLYEGAAAVLRFLRMNGPARLSDIARETRRHVRLVSDDVGHLAALRCVVDASDGAEERSRAWEAFCRVVLDVISDGRGYPVSAVRDKVPGSEFAEAKSALRYLEARGKAAMWRRGGQKVYSIPTEDGVSPLRSGGWSGQQRGPNWTRIEELVAKGPVTQPDLAAELGVSSERVRQITDVLVAEGRIALVPLKGKGRLRCFVSADLDEAEADAALAALGYERRLDGDSGADGDENVAADADDSFGTA